MTAHTEAALSALREHFGFGDFRAGQREVIEAILEGRDTVVVMPTGGGKSLCYQLPAMMKDGVTVVVSPLIALMKDQVDALQARGLPATFINSSVDFEEQKERIRGVRRGDYKLLYVAPERFRSAHFVETLQSTKISLFAVDEAHCISSWGHDFRPDYLRLKTFLQQIGHPQTVALTATATPHVREDIIEQLHLREPRAFVSGFDRPNLSIYVAHTQRDREKITRIRALADQYKGQSGIIYTSTRKSVEQVTQRLREAKLSVVGYHAGMDEVTRASAQNDFMAGRTQMIVATNAFGMGIDKAAIRFVAHYHLPGSIEAYYQEIGRAGRDGLPATCVLLFNYADKRTQDYFIEGSYPPPELIAKVYEALVATGQGRIELSTREIAARACVRNEMAVQSALITLEKAGHIERGATGEHRAVLRLLVPPHEARESVKTRRSAGMKGVLFGLLGGYELTQRNEIELDVAEFSATLDMELTAARRALSSLAEAGLVSYQPARRTRGLVMLDEGPVSRLRIRPEELARRAALEQRKLREMISFCYIENCYRAFILDYFGDRSHVANCGTCGNCQSAHAHGGTRFGGDNTAAPPLDPLSELDRFRMRHVPVALDLESELGEQSRKRRGRENAEAAVESLESFGDGTRTIGITEARELSEDETLRVRKILACAARMEGRFGKGLLAATLRGSRSAKITQGGLDQLSTYGILRDMTQDEIIAYVDALVSANCLNPTTGAYPTISLSKFGSDVMRGRESVKLALPDMSIPAAHGTATPTRMNDGGSSRPTGARASVGAGAKASTVDETYSLYEGGLTIEEIVGQRGISEMTIEKHLAECIVEGRAFDVSQHVSDADRALIEIAVEGLGTERLKPLRDALPQHVTYRMIRFVVAEMQRDANLSDARG
ncbi:MAG: RecQ family ATP-dependent DNA helicase [Pyrinomonadaceae bacterium]